VGVDEQATESLRRIMPFASILGIEMITSTPAEVRARVGWHPSRCTGAGVLHGGVLMGLADSVGATCAFLNLPDGATGTTTIESKTNFLRAVREGHVEAVARPLHVGRSTIVVDTELYDAGGRLVGRTTQTQAVLGGAGAG